MKRLGVLASHPIQYQAPLFRELAKRFELEVFYAHRQSSADQAHADFGVEFEWDVDLLEGYTHEFLHNVARRPDVSRFTGCDTPEIGSRISSGEFDTFLVTGWYLKSHWQAIRACRRAHVPVMARGDSTLGMPRSRVRSIVGGAVRRALLRRFGAFPYVGERNREFLVRFGAPIDALFFSPHAIDNEWFAERAELARAERGQWRREWFGREPTTVALFVGKFVNRKRPLDLVEAAAMARERGRDISLAFVGSGPLESELRDRANRAGVPAIFFGFQNQSALPRYYASADVLVLPSSGSETWGLVVNEAMACGTPAVVADSVGCAPDLVLPGVTGEIFPGGSPLGLSEAVERLVRRVDGAREALAGQIGRYSMTAASAGLERAVEFMLTGARNA